MSQKSLIFVLFCVSGPHEHFSKKKFLTVFDLSDNIVFFLPGGGEHMRKNHKYRVGPNRRAVREWEAWGARLLLAGSERYLVVKK